MKFKFSGTACVLRIHACEPLKFPFLKKKSFKIFFLFASIGGKKTILCDKKRSKVSFVNLRGIFISKPFEITCF